MKRHYVIMMKDLETPLMMGEARYLVGSSGFSYKEAVKIAEEHSRLNHSTGIYKVFTADGEVDKVLEINYVV